MGLLGDDLAVLVHHEKALLVAGFGFLAGSVPDLAAGSTDSNATGHCWFCCVVRASQINDARLIGQINDWAHSCKADDLSP